MSPRAAGGWQQADPGVFDQAVSALAATAQAIEQTVNREDAAVNQLTSGSGWSGRASREFVTKWQAQRTLLQGQVVTQRDAASVYQRFANQLAEARTSWQRLAREAEAIGGTLTPEGEVVFAANPTARADPGRDEEAEAIRRQAAEVTARITAADRQAAAQIHELARRDPRPQPKDTTTIPVLLQAGMNGQIQNAELPPGTDPALVSTWWSALPLAARARLTQNAPNLLRNLDGIPPVVRDQANRAAITSALAATRAEIRAKRQERLDTPYGGNGVRAMGIGVETAALEERAATLQGLLDNKEATILAFSPEGNGRAVVALGNIATARNIGVVVPGMNTTIEDIGNLMGDAQQVRKSIREQFGQGELQNTAMVAWVGYDAPQGLHQAAWPSYAHDGAPNLSNFANGLIATNEGDPHLTMIGHSYGSSLTGHTAAEYGLPADDVAFVGSPGVMTENADQLNLAQGADVWAARNTFDPIEAILPFSDATLGTDPLSPGFDARSFDVNDWSPLWDAHSTYYQDDSLKNLARIIADHPEAVE